jgi:hypothetical protein
MPRDLRFWTIDPWERCYAETGLLVDLADLAFDAGAGYVSVEDLDELRRTRNAGPILQRARERRAAEELACEVARGRVPDWPAWSALMAAEPL